LYTQLQTSSVLYSNDYRLKLLSQKYNSLKSSAVEVQLIGDLKIFLEAVEAFKDNDILNYQNNHRAYSIYIGIIHRY